MNILPGNPALKWISTSVLALGLTACGGGGGAGPSTGVLYDAPISNVEYDGSFPGTTDNSGEFQYAEGDSLIFKLGNFSFPAVPAGATIGLTDLLAAAEVNNQVINLARLLQSIDTDADPELITLPDTTGIDLTALDFDQTLADFEADATVQTLLAQHGNQTNPLTLIPTQDAVNHLYASALALGVDLPNVSVGDKVKNGDLIAVQESMKMELSMLAPCDGVIVSLNCQEGDMIERHSFVAEVKGE